MTESPKLDNEKVLPMEFQKAVNLLVDAIIHINGTRRVSIMLVEGTISDMRSIVEKTWPETNAEGVYEAIGREVKKQISVEIEPPVFLAPRYKKWFNEAVLTSEISLERWYSYKDFLKTQKGFAPQVIESLDRASSEVVDLLGDPRQPGSWKRRGLVIGDVQSGKTATYIGVVNKAADAGYRIVVLLTGGTESLRKQTQYRVDEGFLGKDSKVVHDKVIGVGNFSSTKQFLRGQGMTTYAKDFVGTSFAGQAVGIDPNADHPYVFVIKKNKGILTHLISWLSGQIDHEKFNVPLLVVDDESDYASINTNYRRSGDDNPTAINQKIRELLALTSRSSYMAFTATPFANVFVDHNSWNEALEDDLFPHHYIYALNSPSNYVGAEDYFGTSSKTVSTRLVDVRDAYEIFPEKHNRHLSVLSLPESLEDALYSFVVASAVRLARGDQGPRSMLVNVSRYKNVQSQVYDLVAKEFSRIKAAIEIHAQPPVIGTDTHEILLRLAETHIAYFAEARITWPDVRNCLFKAVYDTTIELVNSSREKSTTDEPRNMIAIGGDVLSRGLTLEGLTVSYFFRIVGSADTLLQMARWFGYRPGYGDLSRVWISSDIADKFRFAVEISDEIRGQIVEMRRLDQTPEDFGLMVRKHPESLAITAKKGVSESRSIVISLSGRRIETTKVPAEVNILLSNEKAVKAFLEQIHDDDPNGVWDQQGLDFQGKLGVSRDRVADLLAEFRYDRGNLLFKNSLHKSIRENTSATFQNWTVGIVGGQGPSLDLTQELKMPTTPTRQVRLSPDRTNGTFRISGKSSRLAGSTDLARTFANPKEKSEVMAIGKPSVYTFLPNPTLLIYPLQPLFKVASSGIGDHKKSLSDAETKSAERTWAELTKGGVKSLMALKIAIPGDPGANAGDVQYLLNGPAIEQYARDYAVSAEDLEDIDE